MVDRFLFKDRDGRTPLPDEFKEALMPKYKHIRVGQELDEAEEENIVEGLLWLDSCNEPCDDLMFWKKLHKKLFGDVWQWAGKIRVTELANDDFNHPGTINENIKKLEDDLKFWLKEKSFSDEREAIARFHEQFLTIHPFTNGNGRTCRILTEYICKKSKIQISTWGSALRENQKEHRDTYIEALLKARREHNFQDLLHFMYS